MVFRYFLKLTRDSVELKQNDKQHEHKHYQNEEKIKQLEAKNGSEQKQINELRKDNGELKDMVIKLQERIINYENRQKTKTA